MPPRTQTSPVPLLPGQDPDQENRASQLELRRDTYRFVHDWPVKVATASFLPEESNYAKAYTASLTKTYAEIAENTVGIATKDLLTDPVKALKIMLGALGKIEHSTVGRDIFSNYDAMAEASADKLKPATWEGYAEIYSKWDEPDIVALVNDLSSLGDAMAWQRIAGVNPTVLARCEALPGNFPVTEAHFAQAIENDSLGAALQEKRVFLADYSALEDVVCGMSDGNQKYLAGPLALYVADKTGVLRSVAIQCGRDATRFPVRTPADDWHWRMANLCVQVADANHHEGSAHLGRTHMVMEAVTLAMKRELAPNHPLAILLEPHTETTLAINASAKTDLIGPGGTVDTVFAAKIRAFGDFVQSQVSTLSIRNCDPRSNLAERGLDDRDVLPIHPYRDDVIPVWDAIAQYVDEYVRLYYTQDSEVQGDPELQAFVVALGAEHGGRLHDVPQASTVAELSGLIARLIFVGSAQHSAVNFPQFRFMSYSPNMAGALFAPVPDLNTPNTEEAFYKLLPPSLIFAKGANMVYLLSDIQDTTLGKYEDGHFVDPRVPAVIARFRANLRGVEAGCKARDAKRYLPYPYLFPSNILQSISI